VRRAIQRVLAPARAAYVGLSYREEVALALSRGALNVAARRADPESPATWEFSAFSQNGEDGVLWELVQRVREPNRYFVEIGAANGLENNTAHLAFAKKWNGLMVEGDARQVADAKRFLGPLNLGVEYVSMLVEPDDAPQLVEICLEREPDLFSLDIDGNDYHVARALFAAGLRPKVVCVEYNSAFGPDAAVAMPYTRGHDYSSSDSQLYYGVSVAGWQQFFGSIGYDFVGVDTKGVNAFFVDPVAVDVDVTKLRRLDFAENFLQRLRHRGGWEVQGPKITGPLQVI